jgi:outer membrane protein assembly factor BamB/SAM-dependent methyltransferase
MTQSNRFWQVLTALSMFICTGSLCPGAGAQDAPVGDIPAVSGLKGGLIVCLGCGDGKLLAGIAGQGQLIVQGFDTDAENVARARELLRARGVYGRASAQHLTSAHLPYAENMVNAMIVVDAGGVADEEVMRVLVPGGTAWRRRDGKWSPTVKPWPADIDEWTHWLHGADCNAVAKDKVVGPPRRMKWIAAPYWSRHHHTVPSVTSMVTARGRIFYIVDEAPDSMDGSAPDKWALVARDAFNGLPLWEKRIDQWGWQAWSDEWTCRFTIPTHIPRRLVAVGDRVYVTLGFNAPLTELDAASGEVLRTFQGADFTDEILCDKGLLIVSLNHAAQHPGSGAKLRQGAADEPPVRKSVAAIDAASGRMLWKTGDFEGLHSKTGSMDRISHLSMCTGGGKVYFVDRDRIVALDLKDGATAWQVPRPQVPEHKMRYNIRITDMCSLVHGDGVVYFAQLDPAKTIDWREIRGKLHAFSAGTGKEMWNRPCASWGWGSPADVFCLQGLVWVDDFKNPFVLGLDPVTGEVKRKVSNEKAFDNGHHHRCYRNKATERFMITSYRGLEFIDWAGQDATSLNHWIRGVCRYGVMPANGLVYATPDPCDCYVSSKVDGFVALAPKGQQAPAGPNQPRLVRGPAYPADANAPSAPQAPAPQTPPGDDWPTFRHDAGRSGSTTSPAPARLVKAWQSDLGARPTATVAVGETIYLADASHEVVALDAETGKCRWRFVAGGRVDSPPTVADGLVVFGSADGWVYCLRSGDGQLAWRFRGAPRDRLIGALDGVESAWPIHGSVLVRDGKACFTAGRSSFLDGGIFAYELDIRTGKCVAERVIASDHDMKVSMLGKALEDTGLLSDILVAGGRSIFMRRCKLFGPDGNQPGDQTYLRSTGPGGLLDDSWNARERWYLGDQSLAEYMVFDSAGVYGVRARNDVDGYGGFFEPGKAGYELFAADLPFKPDPKGKGAGKKFAKRWSIHVPVKVTSMVVAGDTILAAGTPDVIDPKDPWAAYEGRRGGLLMAISAKDGTVMSSRKLDSAPVMDGLTLQPGRLIVTTIDGKVHCLR